MGKIVDKNDFWFIEKNPITKVGVFPYLGKQISQDCEPNKVYYVLRPKEELFKKETLDSLRLIPFINEHTMIGKDFTAPEDKGVDGYLGDNVTHDNDTIYNDLKIVSNKIKEDIENGKKELSLGYLCTYDKQSGTYKGQRYDFIQRNIIGNHIALVNKGRMGSDVRVYDSKDSVLTMDTLEGIEIQKMEYKKNQGEDEMSEKQETKETKLVLDEDKRKLIDEIGGILKGKVDEELWRTIIGKVEKVAYNASEAGKGTDENEEKKEGKDKCGKDTDEVKEVKEVKEKKEEKEEKEEEKSKGMDEGEILAMIARKNKLAQSVENILGTFDHSEMTEKQIAKYACDKLDLSAEDGLEVATLKGYLKGVEKKEKVSVSYKSAEDSADVVDTSLEEYMKNAK